MGIACCSWTPVRLLWLVMGAMLAPTPSAAEDLVVLTSYPPAFYEIFKQRFEAANPDITVSILQRSTASGVRFLLERGDAEVDIFWASSPDAFELLKSQGQLQAIEFDNPTSEQAVAGFPVHDPDGYYYGFALSTFGVAYNPVYLEQHELSVPADWEDLTQPEYWGHIGITSPARSGTSHFIVEAILQSYGWDFGWATFSKLGGNLSTVTARSFGVLDGVKQFRFGIGPTIDFLVTMTEPESVNIRYEPLLPLLLAPASVAVLARAPNPEAAETFVNFLMSTEAQQLLLNPEIGRIPVLDDLRTVALTRDDPSLLEMARQNETLFDSSLSARRYELINLMFDELVVRNRSVLSETWKMLYDAERNNSVDPEALEKARALLMTPPLSEDEVNALVEQEIMRGAAVNSLLSGDQRTILLEMRRQIEANMESAQQLLLNGLPSDAVAN